MEVVFKRIFVLKVLNTIGMGTGIELQGGPQPNVRLRRVRQKGAPILIAQVNK